ncbi:MAG: sulfur carrier protein ThiS adenylyltransferase ThiF [Candidatus Cloacimonetes bacterium]|nr:sulfur carrier protein ThiS adenylyltransferase ThiF [Candidatus Cloacimonadota bacterium]
MQAIKDQFFSRHNPRFIPILRHARIGIAGAGGLGSNVAVTLVRTGIGALVIADFDRVEASNLNRQQFFLSQLGETKVDALKSNLEKIHPFTLLEMHQIRINEENVVPIFGQCDILIEAFDTAESKEMLIETWCSAFPKKPIIVGSGLAGVGNNNALKTRQSGTLYICGDETTQLQGRISPMAPRVGIVANMQANCALEILFKGIQ